MKIIQVHNYYQIKGGEDTVVASEKEMLEQNGHQVITYYKHNDEINQLSFFNKLKLIKKTEWSQDIYTEFTTLLKQENPDICHVHNTLPIISPSIYHACQDANIPVVQTLHNYRLICTNGVLMRNEKICESCLGKSPYRAILKKCYRDSYIQTYTVAKMLAKNTKKQTWNKKVDAYICLTQFAKEKFIAHGLPENKLSIKPNFVYPAEVTATKPEKPYLVFVGRLTESKGVQLFKKIASSEKLKIPIYIIGEGELAKQFSGLKNIKLLGKKGHQETLAYIKNATALILPSLWYEGMPMTILEAFSLDTPVITSNIGAMQSMIQHKKNGLLFQPNNAQQLLDNINFVLNNTDQIKTITKNALMDYEQYYSPQANYVQLFQIYTTLIQSKK